VTTLPRQESFDIICDHPVKESSPIVPLELQDHGVAKINKSRITLERVILTSDVTVLRGNAPVELFHELGPFRAVDVMKGQFIQHVAATRIYWQRD
jgi:hypothetical protein